MTCDDFFRAVPANIKNKAHWRYVQRNPEKRKQSQMEYYDRNKEHIKATRRARYVRQKAERLAAAATVAASE
jgi:hypothetical protein